MGILVDRQNARNCQIIAEAFNYVIEMVKKQHITSVDILGDIFLEKIKFWSEFLPQFKTEL